MLSLADNLSKPYVNPKLRIGNIYQILSSEIDPENYIGRIFAFFNNVENRSCILYLEDEDREGGWDYATILTHRDMTYKKVDLIPQQTTRA